MNHVDQLDDAKKRFLAAKDEIEELRLKIATALCPLKVGDHVSVIEQTRGYEGIVDRIDYCTEASEMLGPIVGSPTSWSVGGLKKSKNSDDLTTRQFSLCGLNSVVAKALRLCLCIECTLSLLAP